MMTADDVFREFASEIRKTTPWPSEKTLRTAAVMGALHKIMQSSALADTHKVYYKGCEEPQEFMLDFCCMDGASNEMLLAAESEWGEKDGDVEDDFQNLSTREPESKS
jgi:hypothetical protein